MSSDVILDTNIAADFMAVYFENNISTGGIFTVKYDLTSALVKRANEILNEFRFGDGVFNKGLIVASSFAFVEIARQFQQISSGRFSLEQFRAFIDSPPDWFLIETLSSDLFMFFNEIPEKVIDSNNKHLSIEWADAIHVVTTLSRGEQSVLCTTDGRIHKITSLRHRLI